MDFGMIRSLLHATPTVEGWTRLCWGLRDEDPQRVVEEFAPYIEGAAARWPAHLRRAPADDVAEQLKRKDMPAPAYLSICRALDLRGRNLSRAQLRQLFDWPELASSIELLAIGHNELAGSSLTALVACPFERLRGLDLSGVTDKRPGELLTLCAAPWLDGIESLCWHQSPLAPEHFDALAASGLPRTLRELDLSYSVAHTEASLSNMLLYSDLEGDLSVEEASSGLDRLLMALAEHDKLELLALNESNACAHDINVLLALLEQDTWPGLHTVGLNALPLMPDLLGRALATFEARRLRCWSLDPAPMADAARLLGRALRTRDWSGAERIGFYSEVLWGDAWDALDFDAIMESPVAAKLTAYWEAEDSWGHADELNIIPDVMSAEQPREQTFVGRDYALAEESTADALLIHHDLLKVRALEEWFEMPLPPSARALTLNHNARMARNVIRRIATHEPFQGQITSLTANGINPIWRAEDLEGFARWRKLHTLTWYNSAWTPEVFVEVMRPAHFPHVRKLCLQQTRWERELDPLLLLVELGWFEQLDELHITSAWHETKLYAKGVKAMCACPHVARLRQLTLHQITETGLRHIAGCAHLGALEELGLSLDTYSYGVDARIVNAVTRSTTLSPRVRAHFAQLTSSFHY